VEKHTQRHEHNARLEIMGKGNGQCKLCKKGQEDQRHLLFNCEKLKPCSDRKNTTRNKQNTKHVVK
jgi:hypothetical protein